MGRRSAMQKFYDPSVQKSVRCRTYLRSRESGSWTELGHSALLSELGTVSFSQRRVGSSDRQRWRPQLSSSGRTQTQGTIWRCPINPIGCTVTAINRHALAVPIPTAAVHGEVVVFAVARRDVSAEAQSSTIITWTINRLPKACLRQHRMQLQRPIRGWLPWSKPVMLFSIRAPLVKVDGLA